MSVGEPKVSGILSPVKRGESIIAQGKPQSGAALGVEIKNKLSPERRSVSDAAEADRQWRGP